MGIKFKFGLLPNLEREEKVLYFKPWILAASFKSLPAYRIFFSLPPLWELGLYVTNRRILLVAYLFRLISEEISLWFPGKADTEDEDVIKKVSIDDSNVLGKSLQIILEYPKKHWYHSRELHLRLFMRDSSALYELISKEGLL